MNDKKNSRKNGFTLVELMVVIVILGLLAGLVSQQVIHYIAKAKVTTTRTQIAIFCSAIKNYKLDTGSYPDNSMGLDALIEEPPDVTGWDPHGYLDGVVSIPTDPWDGEYNYYYTGEMSRPFEIWSLGADGQEGGEGEDADIYDIDISDDDGENFDIQ